MSSISHEAEYNHIYALDGLRGIAVIMVVFAHLFPVGLLAQHQLSFAAVFISMGSTGVDLFFVLSGFLITSILLKHKNSSNYFPAFYARRVLRIFPLYYLLLFLFIVIVPWLGVFSNYGNFWISAGSKFYYWLFLNNFYDELGVAGHAFLAVCWSLAIEEQYYLMWPFIVRKLKPSTLAWVVASCLIGSIALRWFLYLHESFTAGHLHHFTFTHLDGIALGSLLGIAFSTKGYSASKLLQFLARAFPFLAVATIACWTIIALQSAPAAEAFYSQTQVLFGWAISTLFFGSLLVVAIKGEGRLCNLLRYKPLRLWGKYSYAIYLLHLLVAQAIYQVLLLLSNRMGLSNLLLLKTTSLEVAVVYFALLLPIIYFVSKMSWVLIEGPINSLKKYFMY